MYSDMMAYSLCSMHANRYRSTHAGHDAMIGFHRAQEGSSPREFDIFKSRQFFPSAAGVQRGFTFETSPARIYQSEFRGLCFFSQCSSPNVHPFLVDLTPIGYAGRASWALKNKHCAFLVCAALLVGSYAFIEALRSRPTSTFCKLFFF